MPYDLSVTIRGGGYSYLFITDVYYRVFHAYVGLGYFGGFKILNFNIFGVFRKLNIFGGMKILWIFFGVITKLDYTMHFRVFSEGQGTKWRIFFGLLKFQIFIWGA